MSYRTLDMAAYKRRRHFEYFCAMAYPYMGVTVNVDVTDFVRAVKASGLPFFLSLCYCVVRAANSVPEFRQRVRDGGIVEYDWCSGSHTVALEDGTYCYCVLDSRPAFEDYLPAAAAAHEAAKQAVSLDDGEDADSLLFISCFPGISHTALVQPVPSPADSNPRITWGGYFTQEGRTLLPLSLLCHHALVDAAHLSRFLSALDRELAAIAEKYRGAD